MTQDNTSSSNAVTSGATQASGAATKSGPSGTAANYDSHTTINSMADLKNKAPEVYQKMLESIAMKICNEMRHHQENIKKMNDEARQNA